MNIVALSNSIYELLPNYGVPISVFDITYSKKLQYEFPWAKSTDIKTALLALRAAGRITMSYGVNPDSQVFRVKDMGSPSSNSSIWNTDVSREEANNFTPENDEEIQWLHEYVCANALHSYELAVQHVIRLRRLKVLIKQGNPYRK